METAADKKQNLNYQVINANTYAQGVEELRARGEQPKTFKENIEARVVAYENGDRALFDTRLYSCTAVVTKARSTKFKIVPRSVDLIEATDKFKGRFMEVTYDKVPATELDSNNNGRNRGYNRLLEENEIEDHVGWREALENDVALLRAYRDIVFLKGSKKEAMAFCVGKNADRDELRALLASYSDCYSFADGITNMNRKGSFLLGTFMRAAGATEEKNECVSQDPAIAEEDRIAAKINEELSRFNRFINPSTEQSAKAGYAKLKTTVAQNLQELYKDLYKKTRS